MFAGNILQRGVRATQKFAKGDFVLEYAGDYVEKRSDYTARLKQYDETGTPGSFFFEFKYIEKKRW
jgi:SET domain-containing protein